MDLPKFHPNERVDLGDVEFLSDGQLGEFQRTFTSLLVGEATMRVLDGFTHTTTPPTTMTVSLGKAVLAENRNAAVRYGQLAGGGAPPEGVATQNVSFAGLPAASYGVYARFVYGDGDVGNRAFWDTVTDLEQVQAVATRKIAGWQVTVAADATAPGGEWYKLCTVAWDASSLATSTITDRRTFIFEGPSDSSPQPFRPTWGAGNDRNADRALYGTKTLERFASAMLKKIEEIQSDTPTTRWWTAPAECLDKKVSRYGASGLAGNYLPDVTGRDLGASGFRWDVFLRNIDAIGTFDGVSSTVNWSWIAAYFSNTAMAAGSTFFDGGLTIRSDGVDKVNNLSKAALALRNDDNTTGANGIGAVVPVTFRLGSADPDGFDLFAYRNADDDPRLRLRGIIDSGDVGTIFEAAVPGGAPIWDFKASRVLHGKPAGETKNTAYSHTVVSRSITKAWGSVSLGAAPSLGDGFNIDGVAYNGTTELVVTLATPFSSANYCVVATAENFAPLIHVLPGKSALNFKLRAYDASVPGPVDLTAVPSSQIHFLCFGVQP